MRDRKRGEYGRKLRYISVLVFRCLFQMYDARERVCVYWLCVCLYVFVFFLVRLMKLQFENKITKKSHHHQN